MIDFLRQSQGILTGADGFLRVALEPEVKRRPRKSHDFGILSKDEGQRPVLAGVTLTLPDNQAPVHWTAYTGGLGERGTDFKGGIVNGGPTPPGSEIDPVFHEGQADFVVRVSRLHTIWMDTVSRD